MAFRAVMMGLLVAGTAGALPAVPPEDGACAAGVTVAWPVTVLLTQHGPCRAFLRAVTGRHTEPERVRTIVDAVIDRPDLFPSETWRDPAALVAAARSFRERLRFYDALVALADPPVGTEDAVRRLGDFVFSDFDAATGRYDATRAWNDAERERGLAVSSAPTPAPTPMPEAGDGIPETRAMVGPEDERAAFALNFAAGAFGRTPRLARTLARLNDAVQSLLRTDIPVEEWEEEARLYGEVFPRARHINGLVRDLRRATNALRILFDEAQVRGWLVPGRVERRYVQRVTRLLDWYAWRLRATNRPIPFLWVIWMPAVPQWIDQSLREMGRYVDAWAPRSSEPRD